MTKLINLIISKYKNTEFKLDEEISFKYLMMFLFINIIKYLRGFYKFKKFRQHILIGNNTNIYAKEKIIFNGKNFHIDKNCHIDAMSKEGIIIGNNVSIHKNTIIECSGSLKQLGKGLIFGNNVGIGSNSFFGCAGGIEIGDDTIIGNYVSFHSENHNFDNLDILIRLQGVSHKGIRIGNNCWIGAKVTILDGTVVEDGCVIAAGAVLTGKRYGKNSIVAGIPGKVINKR